MDEKKLISTVERVVLSELAKTGMYFVPVVSSNRHVHLSRRDIDKLFSPGYRLKKLRDLTQPGQFACEEYVELETPKGRLSLRVVGPEREETQVEISVTDAVRLGVPVAVRMSGDLKGTPGCRLVRGETRLDIPRGVIVSARHLHMSPEETALYGVKDGDTVSLAIEGARATVFARVIIRSGAGHALEAHIDKDEANAAMLKDGALCRLIREEQAQATIAERPQEKIPLSVSELKYPALITEDDVKAAHIAGVKCLPVGPATIITPLARDAAWEYGIELYTHHPLN